MAVIEGARSSPLQNAGAPVGGTSEVQTVTVTGTPTGGTFKLKFGPFETAAIAHNAAGATVQTELRALPNIGAAGVTVSGAGPYVVTFAGNLAKLAVPLMTLANNSLTGGTTPSVTIVETTPGVNATYRGAAVGALLVDTTNKKLYINTGTALEPTWTVAGTQT